MRAQNPDRPYARQTLALMSGHYPTSTSQVALTTQVAELYAQSSLQDATVVAPQREVVQEVHRIGSVHRVDVLDLLGVLHYHRVELALDAG